MIIKHADDYSALLEALQTQAEGGGPDATRAHRELQRRRAGLRGEEQARYLIDFEFAGNDNWAVLHDLRLEHAGLSAQIDHLLINRWLETYVLETKHVHAGIKITADGEFLQWNAFRKTYEGMPSPLEQNQRHIQVLSRVMDGLALPERLGLRIKPHYHSVVLVAPQARIDRSAHFDSRQVIKSDQLRRRIRNNIAEESTLHTLTTLLKMVSSSSLRELATRLAACHRPRAGHPRPPGTAAAPAGRLRDGRIEPHIAPAPAPAVASHPPPLPAAQTTDTPAHAIGCRHCAGRSGQIQYGKYGYYFRCAACAGNTAIRLECQPGHQPRLRKAGPHFHRDCAQCGSSERIFSNGDSLCS